MSDKSIAAKLDWNKMLGFEQITDVRDAFGREGAARVGRKTGDKSGLKTGFKTGNKVGNKLGSKIGNKPGIKG